MEKLFWQSTVLIKDDELIVGCKTPTALGSPLYPEFNSDWIKKEIDTLSQRFETAFDISEENKKAVKENVIPYWEGRTIYDRILPNIPKNSMEAADEGALFHYYLNRSIGHFNPNYETVLKALPKPKMTIAIFRDSCSATLWKGFPLTPSKESNGGRPTH